MKIRNKSWRIILRRFVCVYMAGMGTLIASSAWGHGGASVEIDSCRIPVVGNHWVHFTAYTPTLTKDSEYCRSIPQAGPTNLVFDYETKQLRQLTIQFEITREPDGERVYYQPPQVQKTGTVNAAVDFSRFGEGDYLAHVTLVNDGKQIDAHLPFSVGGGGGFSLAGITLTLLVAGGLAAFRLRGRSLKRWPGGPGKPKEKHLGV